MSNSQNENSEDVSKRNSESIGEDAMDSTSNKKTRFTKSDSISAVFKELEDGEGSNLEPTEDFKPSEEDMGTSNLESENDIGEPDFETVEDEVEEIIPLHNEVSDLDESEAFDTESINEEEEFEGPSDLENYVESIVNESDDLSSIETADSEENLDAVGGDDLSSVEDDEELLEADDLSVDDELEDYSSIDGDDLDEGDLKVVKVKKASSDGVSLDNVKKSKGPKFSFEMDSSFIITILSLIIGIGILIMGILYFRSGSDRVVDNVLSGETAGLAVFLIIIGLIIIAFSVLRFLSTQKADESSDIFDMLNSIRNIDYEDVKEDNISRDDFDSVFSGVFNKNKDSDFSNDFGDVSSVDETSDFGDDKVSDEDIEALYSKSNLNSQKNTSSSLEQDSQSSTDDFKDIESFEEIEDSIDLNDDDSIDLNDDDSIDDSVDFDDGDSIDDLVASAEEEMIDDSDLKDDKMSSLEDKYSKYNFDKGDDEKPKFKQSVDMSKFEDNLSEEELEAERRRKKEEFEEKKRRIIQGTNFDNSLRK